jgi:carboxypeptidase family protein/TonB-dependent receptor-like protein
MRLRTVLSKLFFLLLMILLGFALSAAAQTADLSGVVMDSSRAVVPKAIITAAHESTGVNRTTISDNQGLYRFSFLKPGFYTIAVHAAGFRPASHSGVKLDVGQEARLDFLVVPATLQQSVTVKGSTSSVQSESPAVGTEVDRQFVENLPLNGRTFQSLIALVPGVVDSSGEGQFNVNGQRDTANYFTVDGVSVNVGIGSIGLFVGPSAGGAIPGFNVFGATNNLVSVDAMQELKLQTSTYPAELGRAAGGQLQIVTRSGTNVFHGSLFDYVRNDVFDANDWFANANGLPTAPLRQNDFGGVFGGPILKNRTFFFLSYEGLRARLPQFLEAVVPSLSARGSATGAMQQLLNAFPLPNGPGDLLTMLARFAGSFSNQASSDSASVRIDHVVNKKLVVFGRYTHAPSSLISRNLSNLDSEQVNLRSLTVGATLTFTPRMTGELRVNYSRNEASGFEELDGFGGAIPLPDSLLFPAPFASPSSSQFQFFAGPLEFTVGRFADNLQRQGNLLDNTSLLLGSHAVKFGVDYRYLSPHYGPRDYKQGIFFFGGVPQVLTGIASRAGIQTLDPMTLVFDNLSAYGQDSWKVYPRLTLMYGLRWELVPPPVAQGGQQLFPLAEFSSDFSNLRLAPAGTPLYQTTFRDFAPRLGAAYKLWDHPGRETVLRGGFGIFYDLGVGNIGDAAVSFPHFRAKGVLDVPYPLSLQAAAPPPRPSLDPPWSGLFRVFGPDHKLPRVFHWNFTVDQSIGSNQTISTSYVGELGRKLLRQTVLLQPNPNFVGSEIDLATNASRSDYHALQVQFQRRLARGLTALLSYTWSHSIDDTSTDTGLDNLTNPERDRGSSDFDVRHAFHGAFTYNIPQPAVKSPLRALLSNWSIDTILTARTAKPVNVSIGNFGDSFTPELEELRPDLVAGVPLYISDSTVPGGRRINPAAFVVPETRQGTLGRNALRGFSLVQTDFDIRRQFNVTERLKLQWRTEFFNLFNHPNFADPDGFLGDFGPPFQANPLFGVSHQMLSDTGPLTPLYHVGGPRSIQVALRLSF